MERAKRQDDRGRGRHLTARVWRAKPASLRLSAFRVRRRVLVAAAVLALLSAAVGYEGWRAYRVHTDLVAARDGLTSLETYMALDVLREDREQALAVRRTLDDASVRLRRARGIAEGDPVLWLISALPYAGRQVDGARALVRSADALVDTGKLASDVLLAYADAPADERLNSVQRGIDLLRSEEPAMARVAEGLRRAQAERAAVPAGLVGPLDGASGHLDRALDRVEGLVSGYERADRLLPEVLGYAGPRRYLVLPQNETELFPSGGLISSYGIATFDGGVLREIDFEYFVTLFDRWQATSGGEYVPPPTALANHLLRGTSWGLGEAGWYPDFPTTAGLAQSFVQRGGVGATDGTIAIDIVFVQELLGLLGPVDIPEYRVTVTGDNVHEVALVQTRGESAVPGNPGKAFLSALARRLLDRFFAAPKSSWPAMLRLFDRMGRERHLQLNFADPDLQALAAEYGLDGSIVETNGDYALLADASVNSTKLNLVLEPRISLQVELREDGSALTVARYEVSNQLPAWRAGRDPVLVRELMWDGVYGSYLRLYATAGARLVDLRIDGRTAGAGEIGVDLGKTVFGRYFPVGPGETRVVEYVYLTPSVFDVAAGEADYSLFVQKQPGTRAVPLTVTVTLPAGARLCETTLDGRSLGSATVVSTDLRTDRRIEVRFRR